MHQEVDHHANSSTHAHQIKTQPGILLKGIKNVLLYAFYLTISWPKVLYLRVPKVGPTDSQKSISKFLPIVATN